MMALVDDIRRAAMFADSHDRPRDKFYNSELTRQRSFSYLGIEMDHRGINAGAHAHARAAKADKAAERLYFAGA